MRGNKDMEIRDSFAQAIAREYELPDLQARQIAHDFFRHFPAIGAATRFVLVDPPPDFPAGNVSAPVDVPNTETELADRYTVRVQVVDDQGARFVTIRGGYAPRNDVLMLERRVAATTSFRFSTSMLPSFSVTTRLTDDQMRQLERVLGVSLAGRILTWLSHRFSKN
jgi:hypothetical protein